MKRIFPQNEKRGYITMKTLIFNLKKVFADMETVTVKVPATVDGKAIFETCYGDLPEELQKSEDEWELEDFADVVSPSVLGNEP